MIKKKILFAVVLVLLLSTLGSAALADGLTKATGSGHYYFADGTYRTTTFSAIELPNGTVTGQVQAVSHVNPILIGHINVDCLRVYPDIAFGDAAVISGWITKAVNPAPGIPDPGYATFFVVDGGEGPEAVDYITGGIIRSDEQYNCQQAPLSYLWSLRRFVFHGEIQVSP